MYCVFLGDGVVGCICGCLCCDGVVGVVFVVCDVVWLLICVLWVKEIIMLEFEKNWSVLCWMFDW